MIRSGSTSRAICCVLLLVVMGYVPAQAKKLRFRGLAKFDKKVGLVVLPKKPIGIVVTSSLHNFGVLLPYSHSWVLESTAAEPLKAEDKTYSVTMRSFEVPQAGVRSYLEEVLNSFESSDAIAIRAVEFLEVNEHVILKYQAGLSSKGPWFWNYWTAAEHEGAGIDLHLSVLDPKDGRGAALTIFLSSLDAKFKSAEGK